MRIAEPGRFTIGTARDRWLPGFDPANRELLLSVGAFLENLIATSRRQGYEVDYRIVAATPKDQDLVDVEMVPARPVDFPLESIRLRRAMRGPHRPQELSLADLQAMRMHSSH